jgi:hypothetical protein
MADIALKLNDRSRSSMERLTQSIEKQSAAYGKTGVERLSVKRDGLIKKVGDEQGMVDGSIGVCRRLHGLLRRFARSALRLLIEQA